MRRLGWATSVSLWAVPLAACGAALGCSSASSTASAPDGGADASNPPEAAVTSVSLQWGTGVEGAQVCAYLAAGLETKAAPSPSSALSCVTTAADGTFTFPSVPIRTNLAVTVNKTGFIPAVLSVGTASTPMDERQQPIRMFPTSGEKDPVPSVMVDWQNKGQVYIVAIGVAGPASISMSPMSGSGPFYSQNGLAYDATATAFLTAAAQFNLAGYFNVDPGTYTLTFAASAVDCEPLLTPAAVLGFPTGAAHTLEAIVLPGYISGYVGGLCTEIPIIVPVDGGAVDSGAVDGSAMDGSTVDGG